MAELKIRAVLYPKIYSDGSQPILIRITQNRKSSYISVGHSIPKGAWNEKEVWEHKPSISEKQKETLSKEEIKDLKEKYKNIILLPNASTINKDIRNKIAELEKQQNKLVALEQNINPEILKNKTQNKDTGNLYRNDFLQFIKKVASDKFQLKQIRTSKKIMVVYNKLNDFLNGKPLPVEKLTSSFLNDFKIYLVTPNEEKKKKGFHNNYVHTILKVLKTIISKEAIRTEKNIMTFNENPFIKFTMPKVLPSHKEKLTIEEIQKLEALDLIKDSDLYHYRNAWLFSLYNAGIRAGDLIQLRWSNVTEEERLEYVMDKTGKIRSIKLLPQALTILKQYKAKKETDFIFPFLDNKGIYSQLISNTDKEKTSPELLAGLFKKVDCCITLYNKGLKVLAKKSKIKKNLCSHIARHSFSDIARKKVSVYDISKMLGHSDIKVTQAYLNSLDVEAMDKAMEEVFN
jgi:integrase